ncbi:MAG: iron ABC transporter permease [Bacteroidota bacterium]
MLAPKSYKVSFLLLGIALTTVFLLNISLGSVAIPFADTLELILGYQSDGPLHYIIWHYRIPKACTAILVGGGLSLSGLLMQTFFRNPLAGPFVLGISSGASLGAALLLMGAASLAMTVTFYPFTDISLTIASSLGSFLVLFVVMVVANRIKDTMALLIIGLMFGSITAAIVSILAYFSSAEQLQRFVFWSYGSLGNLSWHQVLILVNIVFIGTVLSILSIKNLNAYLLGEQYAQSIGVSLKTSKYMIITATGILAGGITAFAGPIAFVGLAVPHLTRQLFDTMEHKILIPAVILYGSVLMLLCDLIAQLPNMASVLPINAITSIVGAPVVIWLLVRKRKIVF